MTSLLKLLLYVCFFLSGICGLIYEVLWSRYLGLFIGNSTYAHAIVLGAFMGGLALGNFYFGKRADRSNDSLRMYARLEIWLGLYALATPALLDLDRAIYIQLGALFEPGSVLGLILKLLFAFPIVLLPATLMGGTLPFMARAFIGRSQHIQKEIGALYAINSLGAVTGTLLSAFVLIPRLGLTTALLATAALNLVVGVTVLWIGRRHRAEPVTAAAESASAIGEVTPRQVRLALVAIGLSGAVALMYELAWFRLFALVLGSSTYSFALMLAAFITGITIGGAITSFLRANKPRAYSLLVVSHLAIGLFMGLALLTYERLPFVFVLIRNSSEWMRADFYLFELVKYLLTFATMLVPTTLFGMILPLTTLLAYTRMEGLGRSIGDAFAINTIGAMVGSLVTGFILLPLLGLKLTFVCGALVNAALGSLLWLHHDRVQQMARVPRLAMVMSAPALILLIGLATPGWSATVLSSGTFRKEFRYTSWSDYREFAAEELGKEVLYHKDGSQVTVLIGRSPDGQSTFLKVNGKADASTVPVDRRTQVLLAHIPAMLHANPKTALNIGLGSGMTCGSLLTHPGMERLDVAEISREVVEGARFFAADNGAFYDDPRTRVYIEDAKTFLQLTDRKYDVIVSEPSNPWMSGVAGLFTREFFELVRDRLAPGGVFSQWFHAYDMSEESSRMVIRTLASTFPHVSLWMNTGSNDFIFIASNDPIEPDFARMAQRMTDPALARDLARARVADVPSLLVNELVSPAMVAAAVGDGRINSDYHPHLEYQAPRDFFYNRTATGFYLARDEKALHLRTSGLLLGRYLKQHRLSDDNYANLTAAMRGAAPAEEGKLLRSAVQAWSQAYPDSTKLARSGYGRGGSIANELARLQAKEAAVAAVSGRSLALEDYLKEYFNLYVNTRSVFYGIPMQTWLELSERAIQQDAYSKESLMEMRATYRRIEGI
jgi:spermidine synthase